MSTSENRIDLDEVQSWAREGGTLARQYFNSVTARRKADRSLVTEADELIERMLVERIAARYPDHGIIGEEQTRRANGSEFVWAVDPLDGTASFVAGLPLWGVSLGLLRNGAPYLGVVYMPLPDDCYWAGPSGGAFLNGSPIQVAAPESWDSEDWLSVPSDTHRRYAIEFSGKTRSISCTSASFLYVARGSAIGALVRRSPIWDIAAGLAILHAAGGVAVGLSGQPLDTAALLDGRPTPEPTIVAAPSQVQALREIIRERPAARRG